MSETRQHDVIVVKFRTWLVHHTLLPNLGVPWCAEVILWYERRLQREVSAEQGTGRLPPCEDIASIPD